MESYRDIRTLYICYFGVREPLVQTQVLPYLREIGKGKSKKVKGKSPDQGKRQKAIGKNGEGDFIKISLLTFEPRRGEEDLREFREVREALAREGIEWDWLPYHKRFSAIATAWDIFRGALHIWRRIGRYDILHGRAHVATLMGAVARKLSRRRPKLLFDIRGFIPEEYTDAGIWPEGGLLYRTAKGAEAWLMREADAFVVLTNRAREILADEIGDRPVEVIPCCVDMERFASATPEARERIRHELGIGERPVMVYVGSFGGWYMTEETADMFGAFKSKYPEAFAMVLTQSPPSMIEPLLRDRGYGDGDLFIRKIPSNEIPEYLSAADVAVSFIKPCYSKQASSPTKNAEYLACGLPIIANPGVGDVDALLANGRVGALISTFDEESYRSSLENIERLGDVSGECRDLAKSEFDLIAVGGERYRNIYAAVAGLDGRDS